MFELFRNPKLDFMSRQAVALSISGALVALSLVIIPVNGLKMGIEFTGGTELQVKYAEPPDVHAIRSQLSAAGFGTPLVTTIGEPEDHEVYIRLAAHAGVEGEEEDPTRAVLQALRGGGQGPAAEGRVDLNIADHATLADLLARAPGLGREGAATLAAAVLEARRQGRTFHDFGDLEGLPGVNSEVRGFLEGQAAIGPLSLRSQSYIGPAVGSELIKKALAAVVLSLIAMLAYIWFRFQLQWGVAAVVALIHDTLITMALFSIFGQEMSLPVVAAFLTLIGYSVNDTVVVFDRIRENLAVRRGRTMSETMNQAINQTLSRTVLTSGLTWIVVLSLFLFGGAALRPFSFVLTVGIIIGTYSSIWVASPIVLRWQAWLERRKGKTGGAEKPQPAGERKAKKVRRTTAG